MVMSMRHGVVIEVGVRNQRVNSSTVILVDFMHMRLRRASRADPGERHGHDGRKELTHDSHGRILPAHSFTRVNDYGHQQFASWKSKAIRLLPRTHISAWLEYWGFRALALPPLEPASRAKARPGRRT